MAKLPSAKDIRAERDGGVKNTVSEKPKQTVTETGKTSAKQPEQSTEPPVRATDPKADQPIPDSSGETSSAPAAVPPNMPGQLSSVRLGQDLNLEDLVSAIVKAIQIDTQTAQQVFKRSLEPYQAREKAMPMAELLRRATVAARGFGHTVNSWYQQPLDPRFPDRKAWWAPCAGCGWHVWARLDRAPNNTKGQPDAELSTPIYGGRLLEKSCVQLRTRSAKGEALMVHRVPDDFAPSGD